MCVRVWSPLLKGVAPYVVKLLVIENLLLLPSADVYIMPYSHVDYHVERRKHGRSQGLCLCVCVCVHICCFVKGKLSEGSIFNAIWFARTTVCH